MDEDGFDADAEQPRWSKIAVEGMGAFFLMFSFRSIPWNSKPNGGMAMAVAIMCLVYSFGDLSGGHMNPAVSLACAIRGAIIPGRAVCYVLAQLVGAVAASLVGFLYREGILLLFSLCRRSEFWWRKKSIHLLGEKLCHTGIATSIIGHCPHASYCTSPQTYDFSHKVGPDATSNERLFQSGRPRPTSRAIIDTSAAPPKGATAKAAAEAAIVPDQKTDKMQDSHFGDIFQSDLHVGCIWRRVPYPYSPTPTTMLNQHRCWRWRMIFYSLFNIVVGVGE